MPHFSLRSRTSGWRRRDRRIPALIAVLAFLPGCSLRDAVDVKPKPAQVNVKGYPLDLAYGKEPPAPRIRRPAPAVTAPFAPIVDLGPIEPPFFDFPTPSNGTPPLPPPRLACPPVGPNTVAVRPITTDVTEPVVAGVYTFQQTGTMELIGLGKFPVAGLTSRTVRNLAVTGATFDYDLELTTGVRKQVLSFHVVPGDGIFISGIVTSVNGESSTFRPLLPVEIFPLPTVELATVTSAGLDPLTGESLVVNATVKEKQRIDGCDEVVDGWYVEDATWTFQRGPASQVYTISYAVATQHGGLIVADHLRTTENVGGLQATLDVRSAFGSITPKPVQAEKGSP